MYSICRTTHPATCIEHSIYCNFYNLKESNLVVAGANKLQIFRIIKYLGYDDDSVDDIANVDNDKNANNNHNQQDNTTNNNVSVDENDINSRQHPTGLQTSTPMADDKRRPIKRELKQQIRMESLQTFELYGNVGSLQSVKLGVSPIRDSLVISFYDAKLSIVQYDPATHDLKTLSLHYFEDDSMKDGYTTNYANEPLVRIDPDGRCAAMLVYGRHAVVIPFFKDNIQEVVDLDNSIQPLTHKPSLNGSITSINDPVILEDKNDTDVNILPSSDIENPTTIPGFISDPTDNLNNLSTSNLNLAHPVQKTKQIVALTPTITNTFRSPVMPSYKIDLNEDKMCGEKIDNIVDIQFLHNYFEPTLVILYEPMRTWSGRVAVRQDTFSMVALSLNVQQRLQPIIWTVHSLPYDCQRILPVPKPIGGVVILGVNELIYLNQSVPTYGVSLNNFTKDSTAFPLKEQDYVNISLDVSQATFISQNRLAILLKDGDIYIVTLFNDGMRCIRSFHFDKVASCVQANCVTMCEDSFLFLGSNLSDSVLLKFTERPLSKRPIQKARDKSKIPSTENLQTQIDKIVKQDLLDASMDENNKADIHDNNDILPGLDADIIDVNNDVTVSIKKESLISNESDPSFGDLQTQEKEQPLEDEDFEIYGPPSKKQRVSISVDHIVEENHNHNLNKSTDTNGCEIDAEEVEKEVSEETQETIEQNSEDNNQEQTQILKVFGWDPDAGSDTDFKNQPSTYYHFDYCDKIACTSPAGRMCYGEAPNISETLPHDPKDPYVEMITTAGHVKDGSICVLQKNIKPKILDTFDLHGCYDMWTVCPSKTSLTKQYVDNHKNTECKYSQATTSEDAQNCIAFEDGGRPLRHTDQANLSSVRSSESKNIESHAYLILSRENSSMVYQLDDEVKELDCSDFDCNNPTILAGNIGKDNLTIQISPSGVRLLDGLNQIQFIRLEGVDKSELYLASLSDPHIVVLSRNGSIYYLELLEADQLRKATSQQSTFKSKAILKLSRQVEDSGRPRIIAMCLYRDTSGIFKLSGEMKTSDRATENKSTQGVIFNDASNDNSNLDDTDIYGCDENEVRQSAIAAANDNLQNSPRREQTKTSASNALSALISGQLDEDEDELLYGTETRPTAPQLESNQPNVDTETGEEINIDDDGEATSASANDKTHNTLHDANQNNIRYWLFTVDERGILEIYSVPDFKLVYLIKNFPNAANVLIDNVQLFANDPSIHGDVKLPVTKEILVEGMGLFNSRPTLYARFETELVVYEAFEYHDTFIEGHLSLRFKKIKTLLLSTIHALDNRLGLNINSKLSSVIGNTEKSSHRKQQKAINEQRLMLDGSSSDRNRWNRRKYWLKSFKNVNGYDGVFLCGPRPHWFIMTHRGQLRSHEMFADGAVYCFAALNNILCPQGFLYYNENDELRISRLQPQLSYDTEWPMRKIDVKRTVHFVSYHVDRKVYCVVTSETEPCKKLVKTGGDPDLKQIEPLRREKGYIPPNKEKFRLQLFDSEDWEIVPDADIELDEWEHVTSLKNVMLASEGTSSGLKAYIAMSTIYCYGEDVSNRGRIWILDLIEVVPEPDKPLTRNKIKKVYCQEQKGPVTTLCQVCGLLLSAVGQKIYLWQLKEDQLVGIAFIDTQIYIHCAISVKNLILVSDIYKSVSLLRYQQETRTLSLVSRDTRPLEVYSCDFVIDNSLLNFVISDADQNIIIYAHKPEMRESLGGTKLLRGADYHLGSYINNFCRLRAKIPRSLSNDPVQSEISRNRHVTMFCTLDGGIGFILPVSEKVYRRLLMLQNDMTVVLPHAAGLNPRAWRTVKQDRRGLTNPCKNILDGDLIYRFLNLSFSEKNEITKKIGTTSDRVLSDLQQIHEAINYF